MYGSQVMGLQTMETLGLHIGVAGLGVAGLGVMVLVWTAHAMWVSHAGMVIGGPATLVSVNRTIHTASMPCRATQKSAPLGTRKQNGAAPVQL